MHPAGRLKLTLGQSLERLAKLHGWRRVALIGAGDGQQIKWLLTTCPRLEILLVEAWASAESPPPVRAADRNGPLDTGARERSPHDLREARALVDKLAATEPDRFMVRDKIPSVPDGALDAVVIEGDYRPAHAAEVASAWLPKLRAGDMLCGRDWQVPCLRAWLNEHRPGWAKHDAGVWSSKEA